MDAITDIAREVGGLIAHRAEKVEIRVGSVPMLVEAISRRVNLIKVDGVSFNQFMGVPVVEDKRIPSNAAVIVSNGEIVNILNFA
ncbi:hypothetical protein GOB02_21735 [Sinorhizobium meliloti]|nr:hypothetical protein [Sinorhizobium meliloti]